MRGTLLSCAVVLIAACGGQHGQSVCANQVPPPAVCMESCDPQPGAANTCPSGYHCTPDGTCDAFCTASGGECGDGYHCTSDGQCKEDGSCTGLECQVVNCTGMNMPSTTISGKVFAPNGTLPLYGVTVYVPNAPIPPYHEGAECTQCTDGLPGAPIVQTTTDEGGNFSLPDLPAGDNIPVVINIGKWRRVITIAHVGQCMDTPITAVDTTLPKSMTDLTPNTKSVDIPRIAISTGSADSLECLIRKLGIDDKEIGTGGGAQRIHLYSDNGSGGKGVGKFKAGFTGGTGSFTDSTTMWDAIDHMKPYDIVILSCEGGQHDETKTQTDMDALKAYADFGGRVFLSHWHNIWIEGDTDGPGTQKPANWAGNNGIASWSNGGNLNNGTIDLIDEANNPKGTSFATWMMNVNPGPPRDQIPIVDGTGRSTCTQVDNTKGERWTYVQGQGGTTQNFQFTTPQETTPDNRCGKVVFSDMHVSGGPALGQDYPNSCGNNGTVGTLSPQEKALAFMFFDISSCVGVLF